MFTYYKYSVLGFMKPVNMFLSLWVYLPVSHFKYSRFCIFCAFAKHHTKYILQDYGAVPSCIYILILVVLTNFIRLFRVEFVLRL